MSNFKLIDLYDMIVNGTNRYFHASQLHSMYFYYSILYSPINILFFDATSYILIVFLRFNFFFMKMLYEINSIRITFEFHIPHSVILFFIFSLNNCMSPSAGGPRIETLEYCTKLVLRLTVACLRRCPSR